MAEVQAQAYILGIPEIDKQHMQFFEMTKTLREYIEQNKEGYQPNQLLSFILRFRNYAFFHFHTEEKLMFANKYPGFFMHKDAHNQFLMAVIAYEEKFEVAYKAHLQAAKEANKGDDESSSDATDATDTGNGTDSADATEPMDAADADDAVEETDAENCNEEASLLDIAEEMNKFVTKWYKNHILKMDKLYVDYLK